MVLAEYPSCRVPISHAVAALAGATVVAAGSVLHVAPIITTLTGGLICFGLRVMALRRVWHLPVARGLSSESVKRETDERPRTY